MFIYNVEQPLMEGRGFSSVLCTVFTVLSVHKASVWGAPPPFLDSEPPAAPQTPPPAQFTVQGPGPRGSTSRNSGARCFGRDHRSAEIASRRRLLI